MDLGPLNKKIGPLPLWGYLAAGAGAIALLAFKKKSGSSAPVVTQPTNADTGAGLSLGDAGGAGIGTYGGSYFGAGQNYYTCQNGTIVSDLSLCPQAPVTPTVPAPTPAPVGQAVAPVPQPVGPAVAPVPTGGSLYPNEAQADAYNANFGNIPGALNYLPGTNGILFTQPIVSNQVLQQYGDPRVAGLQQSIESQLQNAINNGSFHPSGTQGFSASFNGGVPTLSFAQGGVSPGGTALVGEQGPEYVYLPPGSIVEPLPEDVGMFNSGLRKQGHFELYDLNVAVMK